MGQYTTKQTFILLGGRDVTPAVVGHQMVLGIADIDVTGLGQSGERIIAGVRQDSLEIRALFDDAGTAPTAGVASHLTTLFGTIKSTGPGIYASVHLGTLSTTLSPTTTLSAGTGNIGYVGTVLLHKASYPADLRGLARQELALGVDGTWRRGQSHAIKGTMTANSQLVGAVIDNGAATTGGGLWFIQAQLSTAGTAHPLLQHSADADGTTWAQKSAVRIADGQDLGTIDSSLIALAGTINRWTRVINASGATMAGTLVITDILIRT